MDIRSKFSFNPPTALIEALGITENTPFVVSFEDGKLTVEPILDYNEEADDVTVDIESENDAWYEEGYDEGHYDGYTKGYSVGYDDAENGREFKMRTPRTVESTAITTVKTAVSITPPKTPAKHPKKSKVSFHHDRLCCAGGLFF